MATAVAAPRRSAWGPLRHPVFRYLWVATVASNLGTWMHDTAATWLMTSLTSSTVMIALMQTAASLPMLFLALPAGALADIIDRRRLLIVTQLWMAVAAALLAALTVADAVTPDRLLFLTFLLGLGTALNTPAWQATVQDVVPREEVLDAVSLNGVSVNLARSIGPALGGILVSVAGSGAVFLLNATSFLAVVFVLARWQREPEDSPLPGERVVGAMRAGLRYLRHAPVAQGVFIRTAAFVIAASALWALLPVVARRELGLGAVGYGALLGSLGLGAIAGVVALPPVRQRLSTDRLVLLGTLLYAGAMVAVGLLRSVPALCAALFLGGVAWITVMPAFNVATQRVSPAWVRARMLAVYVLMFQGGLALGSALWGVVASRAGVRTALASAALVMVLGLVTAWRWPLAVGEGVDVSPSGHWRDPVVVGTLDHDDGPVLVTVEYRVDAADVPAFTAAMQAVGNQRRRDGAMTWGLYRDTADPSRLLETFVAESWGEHLRQHARATVADRAAEAVARAFHRGPGLPAVSHLIYATARSAGRDHREEAKEIDTLG
jgi:MFS family permease